MGIKLCALEGCVKLVPVNKTGRPRKYHSEECAAKARFLKLLELNNRAMEERNRGKERCPTCGQVVRNRSSSP